MPSWGKFLKISYIRTFSVRFALGLKVSSFLALGGTHMLEEAMRDKNGVVINAKFTWCYP